jgi:hypothetical protein
MARVARGKTVPLPRILNLSTGRESMRQTGFSDAAWGNTTRSYAKSAHALPRAKFEAIVKAAQVYMKPGRRNLSTGATCYDKARIFHFSTFIYHVYYYSRSHDRRVFTFAHDSLRVFPWTTFLR